MYIKDFTAPWRQWQLWAVFTTYKCTYRLTNTLTLLLRAMCCAWCCGQRRQLPTNSSPKLMSVLVMRSQSIEVYFTIALIHLFVSKSFCRDLLEGLFFGLLLVRNLCMHVEQGWLQECWVKNAAINVNAHDVTTCWRAAAYARGKRKWAWRKKQGCNWER